MRGGDPDQGSVFSYVPMIKRIPKGHPLRPMREMVDAALRELSPRFDAMYAKTGRPSIAPERLLRALLLQLLYSIRSERLLMEQLDYNLLFRWFVGLSMDEAVWDPTVFTKNRERLLEADVAAAFFDAVLAQAKAKRLLSSEHFTVDGTLIEAWASHKSFRAKDGKEGGDDDGDPGNPTVSFRGEKRSNETHESTTDPDARLARIKGKEAKLAYRGHLLTENRNGLVLDARLTEADGYAEREAALAMLKGVTPGSTVGGDRGFDEEDFVLRCRALGITPHIAQHTTKRSSRIDRRTTRHPGYALSQRKRKRIEEVFGWMKTVGLLRKTRHRGIEKVGLTFLFTAAAYNLVGMRNLLAEAPT
jgi:transposase